MRNGFLAFCLAIAGNAIAADPQVRDAAAARTMVEGPCAQCHSRLVKGNAEIIYTRADRRVRGPTELAKQVHSCGSQLKAPLFPEEEAHLATYLDTRYYQFKP